MHRGRLRRSSGKIALIQRGDCNFVVKLQNAKDAGTALIFKGHGEGRRALFISATGHDPRGVASWRGYNQAQRAVTRVKIDAKTTPVQQYNVIADSPSGNKNRTIVLGAHLDRWRRGPASTTTGRAHRDPRDRRADGSWTKKPRNRVRFAFWGAEEAGPDRLGPPTSPTWAIERVRTSR